MMNYCLVFIGGGLGSLCRYGISDLMAKYNFEFPLATFIANIFSSIILGILLGISLKTSTSHIHRLMLMTGFCGGFSTFSTFSSETFQLFQAGQHTHAMLNIFLSVIACLISIWIGLKLSEQL